MPPAQELNSSISFGTWVKRRRKALDLTQQQLAKRVGCSVSLIFKIESDERRPSRQIADLLAQHLEIPPDQRNLFLRVARQEKAMDGLESLPTFSELHPVSSIATQEPSVFVTTWNPPSLPVPLTPLVGREHELHAIVQQLQNPSCRLLNLSGPGGVGKTRLALEVAHQLQESFEDGACLVSLASTSSPEFIVPALADSLGYAFSGTAELKSQLLNFLKEKHILLVLDNLEHLLNGIELLDELLSRAPSVKFLTTSREQLNLQSEWVFEIQGLPVPSHMGWETLNTNSAAALFIQRAKQAKRDFTPDADDLHAIARICQLVEGLPLGLELAATWANTLSCREIAEEIERSLDFLTTTKRDIPERHRSLHAVFDYSWNLLSEEEQNILRQLSVFQGGFTREAAEQVAGTTLFLLSSLQSKSLLHRNEARASYYSQHELVRQYATQRRHEDLQNEHSVRDRHARYYLALFAEREPHIHSSQQNEVLRQLTDEIANFRAAWDWAAAQGQFELLGRCLRTFLDVYDLRGWYTEGIERIGSMVLLLQSQAAQPPFSNELGFASAVQGWFLFRRGRLHEAQEAFAQALKRLIPLHNPMVLADVLSMFGPVLASLGESEKALDYVGQGLGAARASGDTWRVAYALMMRGGILAGSGRNEEAYESSQEALAYFRTLGDIRLIVVTLNTLGFVTMQLARYAEARQFLQESLSLASPAEDHWSVGTAYGNLGIIELAQGNLDEAQALLQRSTSLFMDLGMMGDVALYYTYLGDTFAALGAKQEAEHQWLDGIRVAREAQALPAILANRIRLARLRAEQGDPLTAYEWAIWVLGHPAAWKDTKERAETLRTELETQLTEAQMDMARYHAASIVLDPSHEE